MNIKHFRPGLALLLAGWVTATGCSETEIQGVILDEDLTTAELLIPFARGTGNEMTDGYSTDFGGIFLFWGGMVDDVQNDGTSTFETNAAISDFSSRQQGGSIWQQAMEGSWSGLRMWSRSIQVLGREGAAESPLVARALLNHALSEKLIGEHFCEALYGFGPDGGFELPNLGDTEYDNSVIVPIDSAFTRAITGFSLALEFAENAIAAGGEIPEGSDLFDPELTRLAAHGGLAQMHMSLASRGFDPAENWALAVQHARELDTDVIAERIRFDEDNGFSNDVFTSTFENDDYTVWGQRLPDGTVNGTPALGIWEDDPRVDVFKCGVFEGGPQSPIGSRVLDQSTSAGCGGFFRDFVTEWVRFGRGDDLPAWNPTFAGVIGEIEDEATDIPIITGVEMRLIEAEAILETSGDLVAFTDLINEVREHFGADPIDPPTEIGELEWPNAEDDAWSILDRERYLSLWLTGRRYNDMLRWEHPFMFESMAMHPRHRQELAGHQRFTCHPIPSDECNLNLALDCEQLGF